MFLGEVACQGFKDAGERMRGTGTSMTSRENLWGRRGDCGIPAEDFVFDFVIVVLQPEGNVRIDAEGSPEDHGRLPADNGLQDGAGHSFGSQSQQVRVVSGLRPTGPGAGPAVPDVDDEVRGRQRRGVG